MAFSQQAEACIAYCIHNRRKPKGEPIATATTADALKSRADIPRMLLLALSATLIYALVDTVLNRIAFSEGWMIFWPLNGVTIAVLLRRPLRDWAPILTGVAFGTGLGECFDGNSIVLELWLRCVSILEVFICAWLLPSFSDLQGWLSRRYLFLRFCAAIVLGPGISGLLAAAVFRHLQHQHFLAAFNSWATADALGIAALLPISLAVGSSELKALFKHSQVFKTVGVLIVMLAVTTLVFYVTRFPLLFLLYPTLLIVEAVLAFAGSAIALPLVCTVGVYFTMHGRGPFGLWPVDMPIPRGVALQVFLGFNLVALLPASILLMERRKMAIKLTETNERLSILAAMDGLTGIANRRSLDERFADEWKRAIRVHSPLSLLMIDLDHFKDFNDLYGHDAGDRCLKTIAETLREHVRRPQDLAGRFGGEEFAILLPHTPLADAFELAERVRQSIFDMAIRHERSPHARVTVSIGCAATIPAAGADPKELLRVADAALYQAKKVGRNNVATP